MQREPIPSHATPCPYILTRFTRQFNHSELLITILIQSSDLSQNLDMNTFSLHSLVLLLISCCTMMYVAADECTILGLPSKSYQKRDKDVHFLQLDASDNAQLTLECRCTVFNPIWEQHSMISGTWNSHKDPVKCSKNGKDCSPVSYILRKNSAEGFYLSQFTTFDIKEPMVLTCSSYKKMKMVIISVKAPEVEPEVVPAVTTTTGTTSSTKQHSASILSQTTSTSLMTTTTTTTPSASSIQQIT